MDFPAILFIFEGVDCYLLISERVSPKTRKVLIFRKTEELYIPIGRLPVFNQNHLEYWVYQIEKFLIYEKYLQILVHYSHIRETNEKEEFFLCRKITSHFIILFSHFRNNYCYIICYVVY
jgi:hypothetical protein